MTANRNEGMLSMSPAYRSSEAPAHPRRVDIAALPARDHAVQRLLYRMEAAKRLGYRTDRPQLSGASPLFLAARSGIVRARAARKKKGNVPT